MDYELAKKLKDAGFPQNLDNESIHTPQCGGWDKPDPECRDDTRPRDVTLSELIEACGEDFTSLTKRLDEDPPHAWEARASEAMFAPSYGGNNPEEAVARLWLALNKK